MNNNAKVQVEEKNVIQLITGNDVEAVLIDRSMFDILIKGLRKVDIKTYKDKLIDIISQTDDLDVMHHQLDAKYQFQKMIDIYNSMPVTETNEVKVNQSGPKITGKMNLDKIHDESEMH